MKSKFNWPAKALLALAVLLLCALTVSALADTPKATFTFSKTNLKAGDSLTVTWTVTGLKKPYQSLRATLISTTSGESTSPVLSYTSDVNATSLSTSNVYGEKIFVRLNIFDADGVGQTFTSDTLDVAENPNALKATISFSTTKPKAGGKLTATWNITGGKKPYTIEAVMWGRANTGSYSLGRLYDKTGTATSLAVSNVRGKTIQFYLDVTDADGKHRSFNSDTLTVTGGTEPDVQAQFSLDKNAPAEGESLTISWKLTGFQKPYYITAEVMNNNNVCLANLVDETGKTTSLKVPKVTGNTILFHLYVKDADDLIVNYNETYQVVPAAIDLSSATVTMNDKTYTGAAIKPAVTVVLKGKTLVKGTDYTVKYANNVEVGTATVTVTGIGAYKGKATGTFKIKAIDLSKATVTMNDKNYTGAEIKPAVTVVLNGTTLVKGTDYTVKYANNVKVGTAKATVTGTGHYRGQATGTFQIKAVSLSKATLTINNKTYTGAAIKPAVNVELNGKTLVKGTDFTVEYANNVEIGTATVTVTGIGGYKGKATGTFQIKAIDLSKATVTAKNKTYNGKAQKPPVTVTLNGTALVKDTDYTVKYTDNVEVGTAAVTVTGTGHYKGKATGTFRINAIDLSNAAVTMNSKTYTGSAIKPAVKVMLNGTELVKGTDFTVKYANNVEVGTATVTVTGIGHYKGQATGTFRINAIDLSKATVTMNNKTYTGKPLKPDVHVVLNGTELVKGTDFTVEYANNVEVGTATVTVTGIGHYRGTAIGTFQIKQPK